MSSFISWVKKYPMTMLLIICCLIGGPYFGGQRVIEAYENYMGKAKGADVLEEWTQKAMKQQTLMKADAQGTKEQQVAQKGGPFVDVDQSYLDDAVFIGDSRTDTLKMYAGWDNATYYVKTGTNIWDIMDVVPDDENITIDEELQKHQFGKVYIMLGVNELGTGTAETYYQQFKKVVERIRELQPDALIFVESIIHVSALKDAEGTVINNKEINARNKWLKKLADNKTIFYLDYNEVLDDENGALKADSTFEVFICRQTSLNHGKNTSSAMAFNRAAAFCSLSRRGFG